METVTHVPPNTSPLCSDPAIMDTQHTHDGLTHPLLVNLNEHTCTMYMCTTGLFLNTVPSVNSYAHVLVYSWVVLRGQLSLFMQLKIILSLMQLYVFSVVFFWTISTCMYHVDWEIKHDIHSCRQVCKHT